jgi:hypothetical protein
VKIARWVWSRGKEGDYIKFLPIAIKLTGALIQEGLTAFFVESFIEQTGQRDKFCYKR